MLLWYGFYSWFLPNDGNRVLSLSFLCLHEAIFVNKTTTDERRGVKNGRRKTKGTVYIMQRFYTRTMGKWIQRTAEQMEVAKTQRWCFEPVSGNLQRPCLTSSGEDGTRNEVWSINSESSQAIPCIIQNKICKLFNSSSSCWNKG